MSEEEFFAFFSRSILDRPILMLSAYRPEAAPSWSQGPYYQRLGLETLSAASSIRLVRNVLGGLARDPALENRIVEKTEGNPFFVEEIVRELLERGNLVQADDRYVPVQSVDEFVIPNTVQGVLAARMDRLSDDLRQTMQVASIIGRDFAFRLLRDIMALGEDLKTHLTNLVGQALALSRSLGDKSAEATMIATDAMSRQMWGYSYGHETLQSSMRSLEIALSLRDNLTYLKPALHMRAQAEVNLMENRFEMAGSGRSLGASHPIREGRRGLRFRSHTLVHNCFQSLGIHIASYRSFWIPIAHHHIQRGGF